MSIHNSRSNPSGLPCTTSTPILVELPSSVDTVTIPSLQHGRDMPPIIIMSPITLLQDRHRSALFATSQCQLVLNTLLRQHRSSLLGAPHSHLHGGEGWCWCLVPGFVSRTVLGPVFNLTEQETTYHTLPAVFCNVTFVVASMADHIGNGATLSSRCDATAGWAHSCGHVLALVPSSQYSCSR